MTALQERVRVLRSAPGEQTILENSPVGEHQSNGIVEKAVQETEGMIATLTAALEYNIGSKIEPASPIMAWIVEYAGVLLTYYREGKDGKTALERHKGHKHLRPMVECGESVMYLPLNSQDSPNPCPESRFRDGIWLGLDVRTGEVYMGTPSGVVKARTIKRKIDSERGSFDEVMSARGTPWEPVPGIEKADISTAVRIPQIHSSPIFQCLSATNRDS